MIRRTVRLLAAPPRKRAVKPSRRAPSFIVHEDKIRRELSKDLTRQQLDALLGILRGNTARALAKKRGVTHACVGTHMLGVRRHFQVSNNLLLAVHLTSLGYLEGK